MSTNTKRRRSLLLGKTDWANKPLLFLTVWGIPTIILCVSPVLENRMIIGLIWAASLVWMGVACLLNARKCRRTHCFYTGPFFIVMAVISLLHGSDVIAINDNGWRWLGFVIAVVSISIWVFSESILGKYLDR
jgi:hypothetical protein